MKRSIKKLAYLVVVLCMSPIFNSCQDEVLEIIQDPPEAQLKADSEVAQLMAKTATNDGSKDNIIDQSSCFNVVLPVHVFVNSLEIIIDEEEDFEVIEAILDEFEDDDDIIELVFPITIVMPDHEEFLIQNQDQLEEYMELCGDENEEDDDIECIDFVYPIEFSVFNSANNLIRTKVIERDKQMYQFIKNIKSNDVISINFPIDVELSDGTVLTITSLEQLEAALKEADGSCDEDDDNDYGDDDFTKERLDNLLVKCPWVVRDFQRENINLNDTYFEYVMKFYEDGKVKVRARNGDQLTGTWSTKITDRGAKLTLEFESLMDFTLEWFVHDISKDRIKLFTHNGNRIILKKNCDIDIDYTIERVKNVLKECHWRIVRLSIDGTNKEDQYLGTPIKFGEENKLKIRINGELVEGTWDVIKEGHRLLLKMELENRPDLELEWIIGDLTHEKVTLFNENMKMIFKRYCADDQDEDVLFIRNILYGGKWMVAAFTKEDTNKTALFNDYLFTFKNDGGVLVEIGDDEAKGSFLVLRDDGKLRVELNFGELTPLNELNNNWKFISINEGRIELHNYSSNGELECKLVFEKP